jgi:hypothetical protein
VTREAAVQAWTDESGPYDVVWLDNGALRLGVVPALGGRLLSAMRERTELLWRNRALLDERLHPVAGHRPRPASGAMANWVNYGGDKTWPAPQGWSSPEEWAGPPDPVLDSGAYSVDIDAGRVTLVSGHDPRTGLRLRRELRLPAGAASYELSLTATNESRSVVRWALWNVAQLPGGGIVHVGVGRERDDPVELAVGTVAPAWRRLGDGVIAVPAQDAVGKLGFPGAGGWLSYRRGGRELTIEFDVDEHATYPDAGSRAEVWMEHPLERPLDHLGGLDPPDRIVECEVLGPWEPLAPGASTSLELKVTCAP